MTITTTDPGHQVGAAPRLLTVTEVCAALGLSRPTVYVLIDSGDLKSLKIGRSRRISTRALQEFIDARESA